MVKPNSTRREDHPADNQVALASFSKKDMFLNWLSVGNAKKYPPSVCITCLDKVSEYALCKHISLVSVWDITQNSVFKPFYNRLLDNKLLRVTEKSTYKVFIIAGQLYLKFLKEKPWIKASGELIDSTSSDSLVSDVSQMTKESMTAVEEAQLNNLPKGRVIPENVLEWLVTQLNANGTLYLKSVARSYISTICSAPSKLNLPLPLESRDVFACQTVAELDTLWDLFKTAPNYIEVNRNLGHGQFSAGLAAYRRYLEYFAEYHSKTKGNVTVQKIAIAQPSEIPEAVLKALSSDYRNGFKFDSMAIRLLSSKVGFNINDALQDKLKHLMFQRNDDVYFLPDTIADSETMKDITDRADLLIEKYKCFELSELYFCEKQGINNNCIRDIMDFEDLFKFLYNGQIRCVGKYGTRIARTRGKSLYEIFGTIADKINTLAHDKYGGVLSEDDLKMEFRGFSLELLNNVIKEYTDDLVKTEINGIICYQTLDALGFPDDFSDLLAETLDEIDKLELMPSEEVLHTALSLKMGINFKSEYNIPDDRTYRRLITVYYKAKPQREWKGGVFAEVSN